MNLTDLQLRLVVQVVGEQRLRDLRAKLDPKQNELNSQQNERRFFIRQPLTASPIYTTQASS